MTTLKPKTKIMLAVFTLLIVTFLLLFKETSNIVLNTTVKYYLEDLFIQDDEYDLMLGSSTIERLNHSKYLECGRWLNRGIGNSTISTLSSYIKTTFLDINPSIIILYAGENDIVKGLSVDESLSLYKGLIQILLSKYPNSNIHVIAIKSSPKRRKYELKFYKLNNAMQIFSAKTAQVYFHGNKAGVQYNIQSFVDDGIHLTDKGYQTFTAGFNDTCSTN